MVGELLREDTSPPTCHTPVFLQCPVVDRLFRPLSDSGGYPTGGESYSLLKALRVLVFSSFVGNLLLTICNQIASG